MHDIDYYRQRFILEAGLTRSILEQLRPALLDYRPHPKSPTAGELFWTIIRGLQIRLDIVTTNEADGPSVASYPSSDDMVSCRGRLIAALANRGMDIIFRNKANGLIVPTDGVSQTSSLQNRHRLTFLHSSPKTE